MAIENEKTAAWIWSRAVRKVTDAEREGATADFGDFDDEEILVLCDEEVLSQMNFYAEMSDDYSVTRAERAENATVRNVALDEAETRGLSVD